MKGPSALRRRRVPAPTVGELPLRIWGTLLSAWAIGSVAAQDGRWEYPLAVAAVGLFSAAARRHRPEWLLPRKGWAHLGVSLLALGAFLLLRWPRAGGASFPSLAHLSFFSQLLAVFLLCLYVLRELPPREYLFVCGIALVHFSIALLRGFEAYGLVWCLVFCFLLARVLRLRETYKRYGPLPALLHGGASLGAAARRRPSRSGLRQPVRFRAFPESAATLLQDLRTALLLLLAGGCLFLLLPRPGWSSQMALGTAADGTGAGNGEGTRIVKVSRIGFTRKIELGAIQTLKAERRLLMEVRPYDNQGRLLTGDAPIYLHAMAYLDYHNGEWIGDEHFTRLQEDADDGSRDGWIVPPGAVADPPLRQRLVDLQLVNREASLGDLGVAPTPARAIEAGVLLFNQEGDFEFEAGSYPPAYKVRTALLSRSDPAVMGSSFRPSERRYRTFPKDPRLLILKEHAARIVSPAWPRLRIALELERYFQDKERFRYTLSFSAPADREPLAHFVEVRREGYCLHFASAMTLMLRSLGVPCRLAGGYVAEEWSEQKRCLSVSTLHAHAWVEVYFGEAGWLIFDPTPPGESFDSERNRAGTEVIDEEGEAPITPRELEGESFDLDEFLEAYGKEATSGLDSMISGAGAAMEGVAPLPLWGAMCLLVVALLLVRVRLARRASGGKRVRVSERTAAGSSLLQELRRSLRSQGLSWRPGHTAQEVAGRARGRPFHSAVVEVVEAYYRVRFGGEAMRADERRRLLKLARSVRHWQS